MHHSGGGCLMFVETGNIWVLTVISAVIECALKIKALTCVVRWRYSPETTLMGEDGEEKEQWDFPLMLTEPALPKEVQVPGSINDIFPRNVLCPFYIPSPVNSTLKLWTLGSLDFSHLFNPIPGWSLNPTDICLQNTSQFALLPPVLIQALNLPQNRYLTLGCHITTLGLSLPLYNRMIG